MLPHKCGVPTGPGTPHLCSSEEFCLTPRAALLLRFQAPRQAEWPLPLWHFRDGLVTGAVAWVQPAVEAAEIRGALGSPAWIWNAATRTQLVSPAWVLWVPEQSRSVPLRERFSVSAPWVCGRPLWPDEPSEHVWTGAAASRATACEPAFLHWWP